MLRSQLGLAAGFLAGLALAVVFTRLQLPVSGDVEAARRLGIYSVTTVAGYDKARDVWNYLALLCLPTALAFAGWYLLEGRSARDGLSFSIERARPGRLISSWRWVLFASFAAWIIFLDTRFLTKPFDGWIFLGEEGEHLFWAQSVLKGGLYGRDFYTLYGPLMIYPLAILMKLFGPSILVERAYALGLSCLGYLILALFLEATIRNRILKPLLFVVLCAFHSPYVFPSPTLGPLRVALGLLPILAVYGFAKTGSARYLFWSGLSAAVSLLFSQEVGACSSLATLIAMLLASVPERSRAARLKIWLLALVLGLFPMMLYSGLHGVFWELVLHPFDHPRAMLLGFAALPFPDLAAFLRDPLGQPGMLHYSLIAANAVLLTAVLARLYRGDRQPSMVLRLALSVLGIVLFRSALGRSDDAHAFFALLPALLGAFLALDEAVAGPVPARGLRCVPIALCALWVSALMTEPYVTQQCRDFLTHVSRFFGGVLVEPATVRLPELPRANIRFTESTGATIRAIAKFLREKTRPDDRVLFFPNEPAYYFLFDRVPPTRFPGAQFAPTRRHRLEWIADVEAAKVDYVFYSKFTFRGEYLSEEIYAPEPLAYLRDRFYPDTNLGKVVVWKRKAQAELQGSRTSVRRR